MGKKKAHSLTYRGVVYRSLLEIEVVKMLDKLKKKAKAKVTYESEALPYILPERLYVPDFVVTRKDGSVLYIEVKGYLDRDSTRKMLAVKECNPDLEIVFLFSKDNPIRKGAKMRYSDWCKKHGFKYSIGEVPEEWLISKN